MEIRKSRLRPGRSFALRSSTLSALIEAASLQTPVVLHHRCETWWTEGVLFRADFYAPTMGTAAKGDVLHVTCRSVASAERAAAAAFLQVEVLPAFVAWLADIESLPDNATVRRARPSFTRSWDA